MRPRLLLFVILLSLVFGGGCTFDFSLEHRCFTGESCDGGAPSQDSQIDDTSAEDSTSPDIDTLTNDSDPVDTPDPVDTDVSSNDTKETTGTDDGDNIGEGDNCPTIFNPAQLNYDGDSLGDACDACPFTDVTPPCYPTGFKATDLTGLWSGYVMTRNSNILQVLPQPNVTFVSNTLYSKSVSETATFEISENGVLHLQAFEFANGEKRNAVLLVDPTRELAIGHLVETPKAGIIGNATPPNLVVLVRRRNYGMLASTDRVHETQHPIESPVRSWRMYGLTMNADGIHGLQTGFETNAGEDASGLPAMMVKSYDPTTELGLGYMTQNGVVLGQDLTKPFTKPPPSVTFGEGGRIFETPSAFQMEVPLQWTDSSQTEASFTGYLSFSGRFGLLGWTLPIGQVGSAGLLLLSEDSSAPELEADENDPRQTRWGILGVHPSASMRGFVPQGIQNGNALGLMFHRQNGEVAASQDGMVNSHLGDDFIGMDQEVSYLIDTEELVPQPRVCIRPIPAYHYGLAMVCNHVGSAAKNGCRLHDGCWLPLAVGIPLSGKFGQNDYDLDGKDSGAVSGCTAQEEQGDVCPCTIFPGDCPG